AEVAAGDGRGPAEVGASHPALEEAQVEVVKEGFEVVVAALGRLELLAAANLADEVGLGGDVLLTDEATVAGIVDLGDGAAVELAQQDVGKGLEHQFGGGLQEIAQADEEAAFAQADGVVEVGEGIEADLHGGEGRAGLELAEDGEEGGFEIPRHLEHEHKHETQGRRDAKSRLRRRDQGPGVDLEAAWRAARVLSRLSAVTSRQPSSWKR